MFMNILREELVTVCNSVAICCCCTSPPGTIASHILHSKKQSRYTQWRRLGGEEYSSYSFTASALDGGEWSASLHGHALAPGKGPPVPIVQEAGWAPEPVGHRG
jgi:hypothetical protein